MDLHREAITASRLFLVLGIVLLVIFMCRTTTIHFHRLRRIRLQGCAAPPNLHQIDPVFGLDTVIQALRSFRSNKRNASLEQQFRTFGTTFQAQVYNTTKIHTIVPQNLQSVFSTDFDSWGIAPLRLFFFGPFIGKGIMTTDGTFWTHSRALLKPTFSRAQISDLSAYAVHVDRLLAALSKHNGSDFDLKPYFERLALDSSTEFLFRHSTGSLTASPTLDAQAFLQAYNYGQAGIGRRMQLPQWNFLTRDKRFSSSCKLARAFVERCVVQASASMGNAATKEPSRLILAHQLAAQTSDHNDIVNQLLNVFLPAHDATAVALTNVFFHLSRHPTAYARLRQAILALGPHSTWTFERLKACKYLQAVLNETFRLNPSIGQMNRVALRDTMLPAGGGNKGKSPVFVKKGTVLTTSFYALHRSPQIWGQDSDTWRPERWLQKGRNELVKVGHWTFLPFGGGPRICIGMQLALTEVAYAVGRLAQRYQRVDCRDPVWDFVEEWKLTTMAAEEGTISKRITPHHRDRNSKANEEAEALELRRRTIEAQQIYGRGKKIPPRSIKDKKLRSNLRHLEDKYKDAVVKAKDAEILLENESGLLEPEGELERTYKVRQDELKPDLSLETAKKGFELKLDVLGPYVADYTRNGRSLLLAGRKGHVSTMDWRAGELKCELQLGETVKDAKWLHNDQYFAVAQKKYVYIYDHAGVELHCLQKHIEVNHMQFLPYHFLLATVGNAGYLKYTDTSTGATLTEIPTKLGTTTAMTQNPSNAILHLGHQNGTVTLWSPNSTTSLVKLLAHRGPVRSVSIDRSGHYMVSTGADLKMSVWDIRQFREVNNYFLRRPGSSVCVSDRDLTAVSWGTQVSVWRGLFDRAVEDQEKVHSPYMCWGGEGKRIERVRWCPFEDVLGVSHDKGFSSIIVPGAGEPNFDALEINPYETTKQRQENEVKSLLNKLQPEMISLNPDYVGRLDLASAEQRRKEQDLDRKAEDPLKSLKEKARGRGKNSSLRKYLRKKGVKNVVDEKRLQVDELRKQRDREARGVVKKKRREELGPALGRFVRKED